MAKKPLNQTERRAGQPTLFPEGELGGTAQDAIRATGLSLKRLAELLGTSPHTVSRWVRGDAVPSIRQFEVLMQLGNGATPASVQSEHGQSDQVFVSTGARPTGREAPKSSLGNAPKLLPKAQRPLLNELVADDFWGTSSSELDLLLQTRRAKSRVIAAPAVGQGVSAGKNTYTYDAHTYHTKVPPQGIARILSAYLPNGGTVLDPFGGSGMTAVAARTLGLDVIVNELSPAASFIAYHFTESLSPERFRAGVDAIYQELLPLRIELYGTDCRECGSPAEIQYTIWSYKVRCVHCSDWFVLWDHCRQYGNTVREHKILSTFPCPFCAATLTKSRLPRGESVPVLLGYRCCAGKQVEHPLTEKDLQKALDVSQPAKSTWWPTTLLPDGVNLRQPKVHGITSIDRFYTARNLRAMAGMWDAIHRLEDRRLAGFLAFTSTSLYQRVTRLSEFRFWGGSGNTARFNVPYIWNEANVFTTFERKARSIEDHLSTTAPKYSGKRVLHTGSATDLDWLPDSSVDLVFTDPPFGANINYSDMNFLWEAWLERFTNTRPEAIVNRVQGKDVEAYTTLMTASLKEAHRVLREGGKLVLIFMNSAESIWASLRRSLAESGFAIDLVEIFDKQHSTFKMYVNGNTAGSDLVLHCSKAQAGRKAPDVAIQHNTDAAVAAFLSARNAAVPRSHFLHVARPDEVDYRVLYGEFLASTLGSSLPGLDFSHFRDLVDEYLVSVASSPEAL